MPLETSTKADLIARFRVHSSDTGSPEVQIALLSHRISYLTEHFKATSRSTRRTTTHAEGCSSSLANDAAYSTTSRNPMWSGTAASWQG